jgi:DNA (cytosine-5)-methyltransferase 1
MPVPVIDLFAGPGGLGEGFARQEAADFRIVISIEKDEMAHDTLRLRAAHRALRRLGEAVATTWRLWDSLIASEPWNVLFYRLRDCGDPLIRAACLEAEREALNLELGPSSRRQVSDEIRERLMPWMSRGSLPANIALIGGPPCQAYSVVGRSRNRGIDGYTAEEDHRHFLYLEYLHVIAEFRPALFIMENVKGILSSRVQEQRIFETICRDLRRPGIASGMGTSAEYVLLPLPRSQQLLDDPHPDDFIVKAEEHGVPQARHRVIIMGVRRDVYDRLSVVPRLSFSVAPTVHDVIGDLPALQPQVSYRGSISSRQAILDDPVFDRAVAELQSAGHPASRRIAQSMVQVRQAVRTCHVPAGSGDDRSVLTEARDQPRSLCRWLQDRRCRVLANHMSRAHMPSDLVRYLFVASYGAVMGESPRLHDFPKSLLPEHRNVDRDRVGDAIFKDRFRVQLADRFSMTVTSHIAKDGHAFIHPDHAQFRSLTVREAARLQTFPDSYVFLGNRTSQYTQVGNAVPPYLAWQIAGAAASILRSADLL